MKGRTINFTILASFTFFALVYALSLTFGYVEGDDTRTIAYHAIRGNPVLDTPYSFYHSGFDFILSFLPPQESILRIFAMSLSALAQMVYVTLVLFLVFDWLGINTKSQKAGLLSIAVLLIIPELFFQGLLYNPTAVAMALLLSSHHIIRKAFKQPDSLFWLKFLIAALIFGFGVTFRWSTGLYGLVIFVDLLLLSSKNLNQIIKLIAWGFLAIASFGIFLLIEGYGIKEIREVLAFSEKVTSANFKDATIFKKLARFSTFYTPWLLLTVFTGLTVCFRKNPKYIILFLSAIPCYFVYNTTQPKMTSIAHPVIIFFVIVGLLKINEFLTDKFSSKISLSSIVILLLLPWIFGIKVHTPNTILGPGFELNNISKDEKLKKPGIQDLNFNQFHYSIGVGESFMMTTNEGPRPIAGGYGGILVGGKWRNYIQNFERISNEVTNIAINNNYPILRIAGMMFPEIELIKKGFTITNQKTPDTINYLTIRSYSNPQKNLNITLYFLRNNQKIFSTKYQKAIFKGAPSNTAVVFSQNIFLIDRLWKSNEFESKKLSNFSLILTKRIE